MKELEKRILILFEGAYFAFSPTIIQLYDELEKEYHVTIYTVRPKVLCVRRRVIAVPGTNKYFQFYNGERRSHSLQCVTPLSLYQQAA